MADVVITTKVVAPNVSSLQALKKELKEMKSLALNGDGAAAKRVAELTDKMEDLKEQTQTLKGSGVEKLKGSFDLLSQGIGNFDMDKVKMGFKGIGGAMTAIPIFLLIEGFKYLIDNFEEVVKLYEDMTGATEKQTKSVEDLNSELDKQQAKMKGIIETSQGYINKQIEQIKIDEKIKDLQAKGGDNLKEINNLKKQSIALEIANLKTTLISQQGLLKAQDEVKLKGDIYQKEQELKRLDIVKQEEKTATKIVEINDEKLAKLDEQERKWQLDSEKYLADQAKITSDNIAKYNEQEAQAKADLFNDGLISAQKASDAEVAIKKKETDTKVQIEKQSIAAAASLAESFFAFQLNAAEGNEAAQTAIKKKAFEVNKAFQLGQAIIDGARATLSAFASAPPGFKIAAAISAGVFAIAQIAKIASAKFNAGSSGGASLSPVSSSGGGSSTPASQQLPQSNTQPQQSTTFDDKGNKTGGTNWISVKEINATQRSVNRVTEQSRF